MVNRGAVILRYKAPFVKWIQEADPSGQKLELTIEQANREKTVYLISDEDAENAYNSVKCKLITHKGGSRNMTL